MRRAGEPLPAEVCQLLAPFFPDFELRRVRVYEGIPRYVIGKPLGYVNRHKIFFAPGAYRLDTAEGLALLAHEVEHCRQYRQLGRWRFRWRYLLAFWRNRRRGMSWDAAYWHVPFEVAARATEARVLTALRRWQSGFSSAPEQ